MHLTLGVDLPAQLVTRSAIAAALAKAKTEITNPDSPGWVRCDMLGILASYAQHTHAQKNCGGRTKQLK
jgi:hypothetical protein